MALFWTKRKALSTSLLVILVVASSCTNVLADATAEGTCAADDESCSSPGGTDGAATLCEDQNDLCAFWAEEHGECDKNPKCTSFTPDFFQQSRRHNAIIISHYLFVPSQTCMFTANEVARNAQIKESKW